jgi:hypothetical protein
MGRYKTPSASLKRECWCCGREEFAHEGFNNAKVQQYVQKAHEAEQRVLTSCVSEEFLEEQLQNRCNDSDQSSDDRQDADEPATNTRRSRQQHANHA